ncbi:MAG: thioredoxin-like domain-containing protein [Pseudomonadota bacterium]
MKTPGQLWSNYGHGPKRKAACLGLGCCNYQRRPFTLHFLARVISRTKRRLMSLRHRAFYIVLYFVTIAPLSHAQELPQAPAALLQDTLQKLNNGRLDATQPDPNIRQWVFYFGASWCGPCRAFMPELLSTYSEWRNEERPIELVFVSEDGSCSTMESYIRQMRMPWPVVNCRKRSMLPAIQSLSDRALPGVVIVNQDGVVTNSSFWDEYYGQYRQVLASIL